MTGFIPRYAFWNPSTWAIPTLYWDTFSQEQRIHAICRQLGKVINYADMLGVNVDDIASRLKAIEEGQIDPIIVAAIEEWFEENQPEIIQALDRLTETIGNGFDTENTITDALNDVNNTIGNGFDTENTITGALNDVNSTMSDGFDNVNGKIDKINDKFLATPSFAVKARFALEQDDYANLGYQSGCVFEQNDILYSVFWMAYGNAYDHTYIDKLVFANADANAILAVLDIEGDHGQCPSYNPNTKEIAVCSGTTIYYINVEDPAHPYVARSFATPDIDGYGHPNVICWDDSDYNHFYVLKRNPGYGDMLLLKTSTDFNLVDVVTIDVFDDYTTDYQSISVDDGIVYLTESKPENIVMCDVATGERLNTIDIPSFIGFLPIREIEWSTCLNGVLYVSQANYYPGYVVPVIFECNLRDGTITGMEWFRRMVSTYEQKNSQYVLVGWDTADLRNPFNVPAGYGRDRPIFKFVEDAVNYAKYYNLDIMLSFDDDYPSLAVIENFAFELHPLKDAKVGGLSIYNCDMTVVAGSRLTFTGENSSIISPGSYCHAVRIEASRITMGSIWSCNPVGALTPSNGYFISSWISAQGINDFGVAVFASCVVMAKSTSHASVLSQQNTVWLNG